LDKAEEIVGVVLPANEDPALPLNLTFCAIFARLYPSPIYSHREHTLVCWSKPCPTANSKWLTATANRQSHLLLVDYAVMQPVGGVGLETLCHRDAARTHNLDLRGVSAFVEFTGDGDAARWRSATMPPAPRATTTTKTCMLVRFVKFIMFRL